MILDRAFLRIQYFTKYVHLAVIGFQYSIPVIINLLYSEMFCIFRVGLVVLSSCKQLLLRVVRDVDKAENGCAVAFIIVQSYTEELGVDILERG